MKDFLKCKFEALCKELVEPADELDKKNMEALNDLATAVETREFISKKTF